MNGFVTKNYKESKACLPILCALFIFISTFIPANAKAASEASISALGLSLGGSESRFGIGGGYNQELATWLQGGIAAEFEKLSHGDSSLTVWNLRAGPTLNMDGAIPQAYFFSTGVAIRRGNGNIAAGSDDPNGLGGFFQFGKRIPLGVISYRPSATVILVGGLHFRLEFLAFSAFF